MNDLQINSTKREWENEDRVVKEELAARDRAARAEAVDNRTKRLNEASLKLRQYGEDFLVANEDIIQDALAFAEYWADAFVGVGDAYTLIKRDDESTSQFMNRVTEKFASTTKVMGVPQHLITALKDYISAGGNSSSQAVRQDRTRAGKPGELPFLTTDRETGTVGQWWWNIEAREVPENKTFDLQEPAAYSVAFVIGGIEYKTERDILTKWDDVTEHLVTKYVDKEAIVEPWFWGESYTRTKKVAKHEIEYETEPREE